MKHVNSSPAMRHKMAVEGKNSICEEAVTFLNLLCETNINATFSSLSPHIYFLTRYLIPVSGTRMDTVLDLHVPNTHYLQTKCIFLCRFFWKFKFTQQLNAHRILVSAELNAFLQKTRTVDFVSHFLQAS